jgi:hypothetical protein
MPIECCKDCKAPKRYPGCHGSCPEYIAERAEYDRLKAIHDRERDINVSITQQRGERVYKALKCRRYKRV